MKEQETIALGVENSRELLERFLAGFTDENKTRTAPGLPNHAAWTLGHLAFVMHRAAMRLDGGVLPGDVFIEGSTRGDASRFGVEGVAVGSTPMSDGASYPEWTRCVAIFDGACARVAEALRKLPAERLEERIPWGKNDMSLRELGLRMIFHNGTHCGEIVDLRRALGFERVIK
ncbi:MAG: DinB family protein [Phycisphaerales bacterium]|nr:MAG: DinB family protein [Phycisphaerales bacterium]